MKLSRWEYLSNNNCLEVIPNIEIKRPQFFYKYYGISDYSVKSLLNSYLYFSHPLALNDLFDASIQVIDLKKIRLRHLIELYDRHSEFVWKENAPDYHKIKRFIETEYKKDKRGLLHSTLTFYWNIVFKKAGLLSLTTTADNVLLWSYYNNHTGFAIEFSSLPIDNSETFGPFPINYIERYDTIFPKSADISDEHLLYLTNIKSSAWKHENEWRALLKRDNLSIPNYYSNTLSDKNRLVNYSKSKIHSVILGFKFFKGFIPYEIDKKTYKYTTEEGNGGDYLHLKVSLLNSLIENNIPVKQIQTKDDHSFCVESNSINIEIDKKDSIYIVRRDSEKRTPNIRFLRRPEDGNLK